MTSEFEESGDNKPQPLPKATEAKQARPSNNVEAAALEAAFYARATAGEGLSADEVKKIRNASGIAFVGGDGDFPYWRR